MNNREDSKAALFLKKHAVPFFVEKQSKDEEESDKNIIDESELEQLKLSVALLYILLEVLYRAFKMYLHYNRKNINVGHSKEIMSSIKPLIDYFDQDVAE